MYYFIYSGMNVLIFALFYCQVLKAMIYTARMLEQTGLI